MKRENVTLFVVTDEMQPRKVVVPVKLLKISGFAAVFICITLVAVGLDYFGLLLESLEVKRLRAENYQLKKEFSLVETKLNALETSLERVKSFSTKLRLITNVDDQNRGLKLAVPSVRSNQNLEQHMHEPIESRVAVSDMAQEEIPFTSELPINEDQGEMAVEQSRDYAILAIRIDRAVKDTQLREQSVIDLWESLSERQSLINATPSIKPARGWFTSRFGYRISPFTGRPAMHMGIDIAAAPGSPVYAPADGVITYASYDETYGRLVTIDHGYGVSTRFAHNSQIYVQIGQKVSRWDVIAAVGNTGRSTGPHLHYEVRINNIPVDPANYILDE